MSDLTFNLLMLAAGFTLPGLFVATVVIDPYGRSNNVWTRGTGWALTLAGATFVVLSIGSAIGDVI